MDRETLIEEIAEDLFAYVLRGAIAEDHVVPDLSPDGLDNRFESFDALVDLHFILRSDVVEFIQALPQRLRSIKTQTKNARQTTRGEVSGQIDWSTTLKTRNAKSPGNRALFVCSNRYETYDIDENIVLKRLLSIIYTTLDDCEEFLRREPDWMTSRWEDNLELVDQMRELFERNVHVTRIRSPKTYEPTERMIDTATAARAEIYREAAELLREHRRGRRGDEEALRTLLRNTLITPDDEETLFELYVLFRYVKAIENYQDSETTVSTIRTDRQEVAKIESKRGTDVVLYHDNSARDRNLSFVPEPFEKGTAELTRTEKIKRESRRITGEYFSEVGFKRHTNRPDVIVLEINRDDGYEYLITEVKYSTRPETIQQGVSETLEYLAFLRKDHQLVFPEDAPFGSGYNGVLVVKDIEDHETTAPSDQETIRILQASELDEFIPQLLDQIL